MKMPSHDEVILKTLTEATGIQSSEAQYDEHGYLISLGFSKTKLAQFPPEIGRLTTLQSLDLSETQISELPPEIGQLTTLQFLNLSGTQLKECC